MGTYDAFELLGPGTYTMKTYHKPNEQHLPKLN